ncbi:hypothetical protein IJI99_00295 [bacterium]|nr:hypothetical protein [bacterium]
MTKKESQWLRSSGLVAVFILLFFLYLMSDLSPLNYTTDSDQLLQQLGQVSTLHDNDGTPESVVVLPEDFSS